VDRIGARELRQHASRYLDQVKAGETVEVTERGRLIALLVPPGPACSARDGLVASGRLLPRAGALRLPRRVVVSRTSAEVLSELRDDR